MATHLAAWGTDISSNSDSLIIRNSVATNRRDWLRQDEYSHTECIVKSTVDSDGQTEGHGSKTFEILMIEGSPYQRLIAVNNEPLSRELKQDQEEKLSQEVERRRHESASDRRARIGKYKNQEAEEHLLMDQMVTAFNFRLLGKEPVNGVNCYHFEATPKVDYHPPVEKARVLEGMRGQMWIDEQEFHWVKVLAEVTEPVSFGFFIAKVKPGTSFELDQAPFGGFWLPKHFLQTVNASVFGLYGYRSQEEIIYSNYRRADGDLQDRVSLR